MNFFKKLFSKSNYKHPEDDYKVTITEEYVIVEHPKLEIQQVFWTNIKLIKLINTDQGPLLPDIWLTLVADNETCSIPHGAEGYDEVLEIVSKYQDFNFENVINSMTCTDNVEFILWEKSNLQ